MKNETDTAPVISEQISETSTDKKLLKQQLLKQQQKLQYLKPINQIPK